MLVAPAAEFEIWRGDYSTSARKVGTAGAIEMAHDLRPVSFQFQTLTTGPVSVISDVCKWSVELLFRTDDAQLGVVMKFDFLDGRLIGARGDQFALSEGSIR